VSAVDNPVERHVASRNGNLILPVVAFIGSLYFAREILIPIALALLLSFVLAPFVLMLQRAGAHRAVAVATVVGITFAAVLGIGLLVASQVSDLAAELPRYQSTLREKIQSVKGAASGTETLRRAGQVLKDLRGEIDQPAITSSRPPSRPDAEKPTPVEVHQPDQDALSATAGYIKPLVSPLTTAGIVLVFLIFILFQREDLRNRLIVLAGTRDIQRTTVALDDAGDRLSKLFLAQLALNAAFGAVIGAGLWWIGVPSAPLWGAMAMMMRFVPYVGAAISAIIPLLLAAAVGEGWSMLLWTVALFVVLEALVGQFIEPILFGHSTGLSPMAVLVSATFWAWVWGPIGLVLATPLTICLVVAGKHVERFRFIDVMLGDRPPLTAPQLMYQRLLAHDPGEAAEQAETYLKDHDVINYYETIMIEGLKLAVVDHNRGTLDAPQIELIHQCIGEILEHLESDRGDGRGKGDPTGTTGPLEGLRRLAERERADKAPRASGSSRKVICLGGLSQLDDCAALIVANVLENVGAHVSLETADAMSISRVHALDLDEADVICVVFIGEPTTAQVRYLFARLRKRVGDVRIVCVLLGNKDRGPNVLLEADAALVAVSLAEAARLCGETTLSLAS
jgi:predicted PurR-regulated permease PerM